MTLLRKKELILFILLTTSTVFKAQYAPTKDFILSAQLQYGDIVAHHGDVKQIIKGHIYGVELNYIFRTDGCKPWQQGDTIWQ
jgi:hypothetical protein